MSLAIETEKLTKSYGRKARGIEEVDLAVEEGEVFGFLGPNGAGKTTTVRTLLGFLRPTGGRGEVFGLDIRKDSVEVRARVGNLPGEFALEDKMTGEGLLRFFARLRGVKDLGYARELAERLGAELHRPMRRLSRGNKQKIGLVQAMFHRPPLLILDEPTGGLDPLVQEEFLDIIEEVKAEGRTVFFSSHNLAEVERVCDRVGIIRGGRLVAVETTETLDRQVLQARRPHVRGGRGPRGLSRLSPASKTSGLVGSRLAFTLYDDLDEMVKLAAGARARQHGVRAAQPRRGLPHLLRAGERRSTMSTALEQGEAKDTRRRRADALRARLAHGQDAVAECDHLGGCARAL